VKAIVLAAGLGERLRPITLTVPKPYLPLHGGLVIERIIGWLRSWGLEVYVINAYMAERIEAYLRDLGVEFVRAQELLGTAGQLWFIRDRVTEDEDIVVVNGDVITEAPLGDIIEVHGRRGAQLTIVAAEYRLALRYGVLRVSDHGELLDWSEKPTLTFPVAIGIYVIKGSLIKRLGRVKLDMDELARGLVRSGVRVFVYMYKGHYVDMGVPGDYAELLHQRHL